MVSDFQTCTNCGTLVFVDWDGKTCKCGNRFTRKRQAGFLIVPLNETNLPPDNNVGPYGYGVSPDWKAR